MSLPKQVQDQLEQVERMDAEIAASQQPAEAASPAPEPVTEPAPVEAPPAPAPVETAQPKPVDENTWQHRFQTLQGKYNAEVPRLSTQIRDLEAKIADLVAAKASPATPPPAPTKLVTDKDAEAFGSDLIDVMKRAATDVASDLTTAERARLEADKATLKNQLDTVTERQAMSDRRIFFGELERLVPDYEAVNVDQGFLDWLAQADPLSGFVRQDYLNSAFNSFDAGRTAQLFTTYKATIAPAPAPTVDTTRQQLERQVAPGTAKSTPVTTNDASTKLYSIAEIEGFYRDVQAQKYKGKEAEQARLEQEIDLAVAQGRLR